MVLAGFMAPALPQPLGTPALAAPTRCAAAAPNSSELLIGLVDPQPVLGRVYSAANRAQTVLIIVRGLTADGGIGAIDLSATQPMTAVILASPSGESIEPVVPAARNVSGLRGPGGGAISGMAICYAISMPSPPSPVIGTPTSTATTPTPVGIFPTPTSYPTALVYEGTTYETAIALEATAAARETAVSGREDALATTEAEATARSASSAQTATAEREQSTSTSVAATSTASVEAQETANAVATSTAVAVAATGTAEAQATSVAATLTAEAARGDLVFAASSDAEFAAFLLPGTGWSVTGGLQADGSSIRDWVRFPPMPVIADYAIEAEIRMDPNGDCPRNTGIALRGGPNGYYAAGIEWACEPTLRIWAGQQVIASRAWDADDDWHTYRLEVVGAQIRLFVDGAIALAVTSDAFENGDQLAMWSDGVAVSVRAVRVYSLET